MYKNSKTISSTHNLTEVPNKRGTVSSIKLNQEANTKVYWCCEITWIVCEMIKTINEPGNNPSEVHSLYSFFLLVLLVTFQYMINIPAVRRTLESTKTWTEYVTKSSSQFFSFLHRRKKYNFSNKTNGNKMWIDFAFQDIFCFLTFHCYG